MLDLHKTLFVSFTPTNFIDFFSLVYILDLFYFSSWHSDLEFMYYFTLTFILLFCLILGALQHFSVWEV